MLNHVEKLDNGDGRIEPNGAKNLMVKADNTVDKDDRLDDGNGKVWDDPETDTSDEGIQDRQVITWKAQTNKMMLMSKYNSESSLDDDYEAFKSMPIPDQRESNWKSVEFFDADNDTRYTEMKSKFMKSDLDDDAIVQSYNPGTSAEDKANTSVTEQIEDDAVNYADIDYPPCATDQAFEWSADTLLYIIRPRLTLDELDDDWTKFNSMNDKQKRDSDAKCIELFGIDNYTHYQYLRSFFLKQDINDDVVVHYKPSGSLLEGLCNRIKNSSNDAQNAEDIMKLMTLTPKGIVEEVMLKTTIDNTIELFKDNICDLSDFGVEGDLPFFTANELNELGVHSGESNMYSATPDNNKLSDDTNTIQWFKQYELVCAGGVTPYNTTSAWVNKVSQLYSNYNSIKESGDLDKINARKQSILELGWNPELNFTLENRFKASKRLKHILTETYNDVKIIDIKEQVEKYTSIVREDGITQTSQPVYLVFVESSSIFNKAVKMVTNSPFSHVAIGFDSTLTNLYSFSATSHGLGTESIYKYKDVNRIKVFCLFVEETLIGRMKANIIRLTHSRTNYSFLNLLALPLNIEYKAGVNMICSQFVDTMLKIAHLDFTHSDSSLVSPGSMNNKLSRNKAVYKVYDGPIKGYNSDKVLAFIKDFTNTVNYLKESVIIENAEYKSIYESVVKPYIEVEYLTEVSEFPVQFDNDGNLLISKMNSLDFEAEYSKSHKLLVLYEKNDNFDGIKYELCKLWFMNQILEKKIHSSKVDKEQQAEYNKARAKILNDFNKYMALAGKNDKDFNFIKYYNDTPFNDTKIKINGNTLKYTLQLIKHLLIS